MFLWEMPNEYPEELIGSYDETVSPNRFLFKSGGDVTMNDSPVVRFDCTRKELAGFDDLANSALVPLVSTRIQSLLLDRCPDEKLNPVQIGLFRPEDMRW
jgi:hypothetical protein